jgi:Domain of unknown function (DUF4145)
MKSTKAPCSSCVGETTHKILFQHDQRDDDSIDSYLLLECGGCQTISMAHRSQFIADGSGDVEWKYYPSPVSRKKPDWIGNLTLGYENESELSWLLAEVYQAVDGGQYRLAAMGIRALLEQVMILKVGNRRTFDEKLDEFQKQGYVSLIQRDAMRATLDVGDAAMHRAFKPTEKELKVALDIVEGVFAPIFGHSEAAQKLVDRVPPRATRKPTKKSTKKP